MIKIIYPNDKSYLDELALTEISLTGASSYSVEHMAKKAYTILIKLYDLRPFEANIIKQDMLSIGGEVAVHKLAISCKVDLCDAVIIGTVLQIEKLTAKMMYQTPRICKFSELITKKLNSINKSTKQKQNNMQNVQVVNIVGRSSKYFDDCINEVQIKKSTTIDNMNEKLANHVSKNRIALNLASKNWLKYIDKNVLDKLEYIRIEDSSLNQLVSYIENVGFIKNLYEVRPEAKLTIMIAETERNNRAKNLDFIAKHSNLGVRYIYELPYNETVANIYIPNASNINSSSIICATAIAGTSDNVVLSQVNIIAQTALALLTSLSNNISYVRTVKPNIVSKTIQSISL